MAEQFGPNPWPQMPSTTDQSYPYTSPAFFVLLSPILEFFVLPHSAAKNPAGLVLVECLFLLGLVLLSWRVRLEQKQAASMAA